MADEKARKDEKPGEDSATPDEKPVEEAPAKRQDETVPGGRYRVNGVLVNAEGKPIK